MKKWRKPLITLGVIAAMFLIIFLFRIPILRGIGHILISEDLNEKVDAIFVLSGGPLDRGNEAAKLYQHGISPKVICTGENAPSDFIAVGLLYMESEITQKYLLQKGVPTSNIILLKKGTSTREEEQVILSYCQQNNLKKVMVLSSKFHTCRIHRTFRKPFEQAGITLLIHGAPSSAYDEENWWKSEDGLISLNNEYIKLMYYWWKY